MNRVAFTVIGKPKGKGRAKFTRTGRPYTPKATVQAESDIAWEFKLAARNRAVETGVPFKIMTGTIRLTIIATFNIPPSWSKKDREAALSGEMDYTGKPDRDNIEKLVADALNGVAWMDDAQVGKGPPVVRRYGTGERIEVVVEEIEAVGRKSPSERRREAKAEKGPGIRKARIKRPSTAPMDRVEHAIGRRLK
jgi:Holliday junction resolvase RusA-like endonuclease